MKILQGSPFGAHNYRQTPEKPRLHPHLKDLSIDRTMIGTMVAYSPVNTQSNLFEYPYYQLSQFVLSANFKYL